METLQKNRYIYYLQLGNQTSAGYILLAKKFKNFGIELIPIHYTELDVFLKTGSENLMIVCQSLEQLKVLNKFSQKLLNYLLSAGKANLFLFSSFALNSVLYKHYQRKKVFQYHLPLSINMIVGEVITQILSKNKKLNEWPGGKRSSVHQLLIKPI